MAGLAPGSRADAMRLKTDVNFMKFVFTDNEWQRDVMDAGDGVLVVVDSFDPMWGPCEMAAGHFSNLFYDFGEEYGMKFVRAQNSNIAALMEFRNTCEPYFLFYLNGEMVQKIKGADIVKAKQTIFDKAPKLK